MFALSVVLSTHAFALDNKPSNFDVTAWQTLITKAIVSGTQLDFDAGEIRYLAHIEPGDPAQPHQAEYFTVYGAYDINQVYQPTHVSIVSENWSQDGQGRWVIAQQLLEVSLDGELTGVSAGRIVEESGGVVVSSETIPVGPVTDTSELQKWSEKLAQWLDWAK